MNKYSRTEESVNISSHALGAALSVIGLALMLLKTHTETSTLPFLAYLIYGLSMIWLFTASSIYHNQTKEKERKKWQIIDHASIYVLIAGTYTPYCLLALPKTKGLILLSICWGLALAGIIFKLFYTGRFNTVSTILYTLMGWLAAFFYHDLLANVDIDGLYWLLAGGLIYTVGAALYLLHFLKFNHALFHVFVLVAAFCHFWSIYNYL